MAGLKAKGIAMPHMMVSVGLVYHMSTVSAAHTKSFPVALGSAAAHDSRYATVAAAPNYFSAALGRLGRRRLSVVALLDSAPSKLPSIPLTRPIVLPRDRWTAFSSRGEQYVIVPPAGAKTL
ncbi:unnamed protein product [Boreogadus saida]